MIDRIRLTATAKNQLMTLKRKTGLEHNNSICRYAFCLSLENNSIPPQEILNFNGGLEIDWRTFTGGNEDLYLNLAIFRVFQDGDEVGEENIRGSVISHVHRGLSFLASKTDVELKDLFGRFI
jgi:DNA sulfur modification protein DndE